MSCHENYWSTAGTVTGDDALVAAAGGVPAPSAGEAPASADSVRVAEGSVAATTGKIFAAAADEDDRAVMMVWELLLQSSAMATGNFWSQVDVGMCSK
jgi:hypothetical protein